MVPDEKVPESISGTEYTGGGRKDALSSTERQEERGKEDVSKIYREKKLMQFIAEAFIL